MFKIQTECIYNCKACLFVSKSKRNSQNRDICFLSISHSPTTDRSPKLSIKYQPNPKLFRDPRARVGKHTSTVNSLNDGTYYVNIHFNACLHNNNLFHILNEHVHMLEKTRVQSVHN